MRSKQIEVKNKLLNYEELGYDKYGRNSILDESRFSAPNDVDAFFEVPTQYIELGMVRDSIRENLLRDGKVVEGMLADASVTTEALADLAVDTTKLADLAVEAANLANSSVTMEKIANAAVGSAAIAQLAVGTAHIAHGAILDAHIENATITAAKISTVYAENIIGQNIYGVNVIAGEFRSSNGLGRIYTDTSGDIYMIGKDDAVLGADGSPRCQAGQGSFRPIGGGYDLGTGGDRWDIAYMEECNTREINLGDGWSIETDSDDIQFKKNGSTKGKLNNDGDWIIDGELEENH